MHVLSYSKAFIVSALFSVVSFSSATCMELIGADSVSSAHNVKLYKTQSDFFVEDENAAYRVEKININPLLQEVMKRRAMGKFIGDGQGYIRVKQLSDGQYNLEAKVRGNGGGPILATAAAIGVRASGYGAFIVGIFATKGELLLHTTEIVECIEVAANSASAVALTLPTP